jgi:hypothetical protein
MASAFQSPKLDNYLTRKLSNTEVSQSRGRAIR